MTFGRLNCDVILPSPKVSRKQCALYVTPNNLLYITSHGGTNPTVVNTRKITLDTEMVELRAGDVIYMGSTNEHSKDCYQYLVRKNLMDISLIKEEIEESVDAEEEYITITISDDEEFDQEYELSVKASLINDNDAQLMNPNNNLIKNESINYESSSQNVSIKTEEPGEIQLQDVSVRLTRLTKEEIECHKKRKLVKSETIEFAPKRTKADGSNFTQESANESSDSKFILQSANESKDTIFAQESVNEPCCSKSTLGNTNDSYNYSKSTLEFANEQCCSKSALESANESYCSHDSGSDLMMSATQSPYHFTDEEDTELLYKPKIKNKGIAQQIVCYMEKEDQKYTTKRKIFTQHKTHYKKFKTDIYETQEVPHEKALLSNIPEIKIYVKPERGLKIRDNNIPMKISQDVLENTKSENTEDHTICLDESDLQNTPLILPVTTETESNYKISISIQDLLPDDNFHQLNDLPNTHESLSKTEGNQIKNYSISNLNLPDGLDDISDDDISNYVHDDEPNKEEHTSEVALEPTNEDHMIRSSHSPVKVQKSINKHFSIEKESVRITKTIFIPHLPMVKPSRKISTNQKQKTKEPIDTISNKNDDDTCLNLIQEKDRVKARKEKLKELECRKKILFNNDEQSITSPTKAPTISLPNRNNRSDFLTNTANEQIQNSSIFLPRPRPINTSSHISSEEQLTSMNSSECPRKELKSILAKTRRHYSATTHRENQEEIKPSYLRPPGPRTRIARSSSTEQSLPVPISAPEDQRLLSTVPLPPRSVRFTENAVKTYPVSPERLTKPVPKYRMKNPLLHNMGESDVVAQMECLTLKVLQWQASWLLEDHGPLMVREMRNSGTAQFSPGQDPRDRVVEPTTLHFESFEIYYKEWLPRVLFDLWTSISGSYTPEEAGKVKGQVISFDLNKFDDLKKTAVLTFRVKVKRDSVRPSIGDFVLVDLACYKKTKEHELSDSYFGFVRRDVMRSGKMKDKNLLIDEYKYDVLIPYYEQIVMPSQPISMLMLRGCRGTLDSLQGLFELSSSPLQEILLSPTMRTMTAPSLDHLYPRRRLLQTFEDLSDILMECLPISKQQTEVVKQISQTLCCETPSLSVVEGPQGSGKTSTLVWILMNLLADSTWHEEARFSRFLVCASSAKSLNDITCKIELALQKLKGTFRNDVGKVILGDCAGLDPSMRMFSLQEQMLQTSSVDEQELAMMGGDMNIMTAAANAVRHSLSAARSNSERWHKKKLLAQAEQAPGGHAPFLKSLHQEKDIRDVLSKAHILLTTVEGLASKHFVSNFGKGKSCQTPICLLDDAQRIPEVQSLLSLVGGASRLVLTGDLNLNERVMPETQKSLIHRVSHALNDDLRRRSRGNTPGQMSAESSEFLDGLTYYRLTKYDHVK